MTNTEKKALALLNEAGTEWSALCRAIEQHEAFKRDVSKAITDLTYIRHQYTFARGEVLGHLEKFVLKEPVDPLVEALDDLKDGRADNTTESYAACLRAALAARGLDVRKIERDA